MLPALEEETSVSRPLFYPPSFLLVPILAIPLLLALVCLFIFFATSSNSISDLPEISMAAQPVNAEAGNDFGCHDVSLQRLSKVPWTEEAPLRPPPSINEQLKARRYDVAALMSIRATMNPGSVQLRINPAALTGMCLLL